MVYFFVLILIFFPTIWIVAEKANAEPIYTAILEDQQMYDMEFFVGVDRSEYVGLALLESVAVSNNGWYALCFSDVTSHHVNLYDQSCTFVKHFTFYEAGAISVSFDEEGGNLVVFPFRKDVLIKIDDEGNYIGSIRSQSELDKVAKMDAMEKFQVSCGGNTYSFSGKNIFSLNSQVFTVMDQNENLLFKYAPDLHWRIARTIFSIAFAIFCSVITSLIRKKNNLRECK